MKKISLKTLLCSAVLTVALLSPNLANAAAVEIPGSADAGRVDNDIRSPDFQNNVTPEVNVPSVRVENAPAGADNIFLTLRNIDVEGATVYAADELAAVYDQYIGQRISLTTVYEIAQRITLKYRNDGYLITQTVVPQQTIEGGNIRLRVVEGFIDNVNVQGVKDSLFATRVNQYANGLRRQSPLTAQSLERWLLLINDLPGISARSIISPSETSIGGADITIIPTQDPFELALSVDNYGSRFLGPVLGSAAVQFNNVFNLAEKIEFQGVRSVDDSDLVYGSAAYSMPINQYGTYFGFDVSHSRTSPGFTLEPFEIDGKSTFAGIFVKHPVLRSRSSDFELSLRFDYRDQQSDNIVETFTREDNLYALRLGAQYESIDNFFTPAVNMLDVTISHGLNIFNSSETGDANLSRSNANPQYAKAEIEYRRLQTVNSYLNILAGVKGQYASDALPSAEEIGIGGRDYGRGYDPSELTGDHGYVAKVELQLNNPVALPAATNGIIGDYQLFSFYDVGTVWNDKEIVSNLKRSSLASTGVGIRTDIAKNFGAEFVATVPLTKDVETRGHQGPRYFFSVTANF